MPKRTPKHVQVASALRRRIRSRGLSLGDSVGTEQELAQAHNCSRNTIRRAIDTLVNEGLVRRKHGSGHYVARPGGAEREAVIGLIQPNILNAEILRLSQAITLQASRMGYRVVLGVMEEQPSIERDFINDLHRLKAAGIVKFPTTPEVEAQLHAHIRGLGLPLVMINDFWTGTPHVHHVGFDESAALNQAVEHLVRLGHTRIGWLDGSDGPRVRALSTLRHLLSERNLELPDTRVLLCPPYEPPPIEELLGDTNGAPTAIITPYDGMAVRLIEALPEIGLEVSRDVSIVNLNGHPFYSGSGWDLTTAVPPEDQIVSKALDILTSREQDEAVCQYLFRPGFHEGSTTAPLARGAQVQSALKIVRT